MPPPALILTNLATARWRAHPLARPMTGGFTLAELMTALVLIGILVVFGAPNFAAWIASARVRTAAEALSGGLRIAHAEALKRNASIDFVLTDDDPSSASAVASAAARGWQVRTIEVPANVVQGRSPAETSSDLAITASAGSIRFSGLGRTLPLGTSFSVDIASGVGGSRPLRVLVASGGAIRTCDPAVAATDPRGC